MSQPITFYSDKAKAFALTNKQDNGLKIELINNAIDSIYKRNEYLKYFYNLFMEVTTEDNLFFDRISEFKDANGIVLRIKYEANAFSFLSNLHEMFDSYPFIYFGIYSQVNVVNEMLSWNQLPDTSINILKDELTSFKGNHLYSKLKNLNNFRKHGALPKIKNLFTYLEIDISKDGSGEFVNLKDLMIELHDKLMPQYFELLNLTFEINE